MQVSQKKLQLILGAFATLTRHGEMVGIRCDRATCILLSGLPYLSLLRRELTIVLQQRTTIGSQSSHRAKQTASR
jgi:hypothetical protein